MLKSIILGSKSGFFRTAQYEYFCLVIGLHSEAEEAGKGLNALQSFSLTCLHILHRAEQHLTNLHLPQLQLLPAAGLGQQSVSQHICVCLFAHIWVFMCKSCRLGHAGHLHFLSYISCFD